MGKLVLCLLFLNHGLACFWYWIGRSTSGGWALELGLDVGIADARAYCMAMHWSLTQFHSNMELSPHNLTERVFSVLVVFVAFILVSAFVSSLTNMMVRMQALHNERARQQQALLGYLKQHKISLKLSVRAKKYFISQLEERQLREHEAKLLEILPMHLMMDLHMEARGPVLTAHNFFNDMHTKFPRAFRRLCHEGVGQLTVQIGDIVFTGGDACTRMLFVSRGRLTYTLGLTSLGSCIDLGVDPGQNMSNNSSETEVRSVTVMKGKFISEPALWSHWENVGELSSTVGGHLLTLEVVDLVKTIKLYEKAYFLALLYAQEFLDNMNEFGCTDLGPKAVRMSVGRVSTGESLSRDSVVVSKPLSIRSMF